MQGASKNAGLRNIPQIVIRTPIYDLRVIPEFSAFGSPGWDLTLELP